MRNYKLAQCAECGPEADWDKPEFLLERIDDNFALRVTSIKCKKCGTVIKHYPDKGEKIYLPNK